MARGILRFLARRHGHNRFDITYMLSYIYLVVGIVIMFGPVVWLVMSSFKPPSLLTKRPITFLPYQQQTIQIQGYDAPLRLYDLKLPDGSTKRMAALLQNGKDWRFTENYLYLIDPEQPGREPVEILEQQASAYYLYTNVTGEQQLYLHQGNHEDAFYRTLNAAQLDAKPTEIWGELIESLGGMEMVRTTVTYQNRALPIYTVDLEDGTSTPMAALLDPDGTLQEVEKFGYVYLRMVDPAHVASDPMEVLKPDDLEARDTKNTVDLGYDSQTLNVQRIKDTQLRIAVLVNADGTLQVEEQDSRRYLKVLDPHNLAADGIVLLEIDSKKDPETQQKSFKFYFGDGEDGKALIEKTSDVSSLRLYDLADLAATPVMAERALVDEISEALGPDYRLQLYTIDETNIRVVVLKDPSGWDQRVNRLYFSLVPAADPAAEPIDVLANSPRLARATVEVEGEVLPLYSVQMADGERRRMAAIVENGAEKRNQRSYIFLIDPDAPPETMPQTIDEAVQNEHVTKALFDDIEPVRYVYFDLDNYEGAIKSFDFLLYLRNSIVVTVVATAITLLINSMAAFGLSKYKFRGRDAIFLLIISTLMVPVTVIMIPAFLVVSEVGWSYSLWGLIVPGAATPTGVFLLRQYMLTIPDELLDSARIDGASEWRIYWQVILPLAKPALAVLAIFSVMWRWNDFLWPLIVTAGREELYTLPVALNNFQGNLNVQWHYILAMTVLTLLPVAVVFVFLQRYITTGIATTGMK